jgi:hypothetical protein
MSSSLTGGDEGGFGVELGTFAVVSRVRLRVGEDCFIREDFQEQYHFEKELQGEVN